MIKYLVIWNVFVFLMYGIDKYKARHNKWRISENMLLGSAFFGGALGAFVGMMFFHHKTRKIKFTVGVPLALIFNISAVILITKRGI